MLEQVLSQRRSVSTTLFGPRNSAPPPAALGRPAPRPQTSEAIEKSVQRLTRTDHGRGKFGNSLAEWHANHVAGTSGTHDLPASSAGFQAHWRKNRPATVAEWTAKTGGAADMALVRAYKGPPLRIIRQR